MFLLTRKIILILFFCLLFIMSAHGLRADRNVGAAGEDAYLLTVGSLQEEGTGIEVEGRIVPKKFANLAMRSSGSIDEIFVKEGERVESDQILLRQSGGDQLLAQIAAAEMELLLAQQGLDALYKNADLARAQAGRELAQAQKEFDTAEYNLGRVKRPTPQLRIDQAYANMLLAENQLEKGRDQLSRTEKKFSNPNHFLWMFFNKREVRLLLTSLERNITSMQARYEDSIDKYADLLAPVDEVDLVLAEADLAFAQAQLTDAERKYALLIDGPDPDDVAATQARISAAEANLRASQNALEELELLAPFAGTVVEVSTKSGEWVEVGQPIVVLAEVSEWAVETEDLTELEVPQIRLGQEATVVPEALPELILSGTVESISKISEIKSGDVTYTARILMNETDPRLRWGMTVAVILEE